MPLKNVCGNSTTDVKKWVRRWVKRLCDRKTEIKDQTGNRCPTISVTENNNGACDQLTQKNNCTAHCIIIGCYLVMAHSITFSN